MPFFYSFDNYLFSPQNILYILPMQTVREWFLQNYDLFTTKKTSTCDKSGKLLYKSLGKLIPRKQLEKEVKEVKIIYLT